MKRLVIVVIATGVILGGIALSKTSRIEVINNEPQVIEKAVEVDALDKEIKTRQEANLPQIEASAQRAYDEAYIQEMKKVELQVIQNFNTKLDARQTELEKETKVYWRDERIVALIKKTFPEDPYRAVAIARCESVNFTYKDKLSAPNKNGTRDGGVFQINDLHLERMKEMGLDRLDVEDNVEFARKLYEERKWQPWVCHTTSLAYN